MTIPNVFSCVKKVACLTCFLRSDLKFPLGLEFTNYYSNMQRKHIVARHRHFSGWSQVSYLLDAYVRYQEKLLPRSEK